MVRSPGPTGLMVNRPNVPALSISLLNMFYKIKIIKVKNFVIDIRPSVRGLAVLTTAVPR